MPGQFVNEGFGWECKRCRASEDAQTESSSGSTKAGSSSEGAKAVPGATTLARFFREGEAEGGGPRLSSAALARWKDETRRVLRCDRCGAEENVSD
jgi:DNA-directed RNA polymerase subunit M/transcription elongation factor TFIIS